MQTINFNQADHECLSYRDGDWIIYRCAEPECQTYERRINWKTGEMLVINNNEFLHRGIHIGSQGDLDS